MQAEHRIQPDRLYGGMGGCMNCKDLNTTMMEALHKEGSTGKGACIHVPGTMAANGYDDYPHDMYMVQVIRQWCPDAVIRPIDVFEDEETVWRIKQAMRDITAYAIAHPEYMHFVNMSFVWDGYDEDAHTLLKVLLGNNVTVFAAAGNDGKENLRYYPSHYEEPICVAALNEDGTKANFSTWHDEMDFAEWGVDIPCVDKAGKVEPISGTSIATPICLAKAVLLAEQYKDRHGAKPTEPQIFQILLDAAQDLGKSGKDLETGYGFVNIQVEDKTMFDVINTGLKWPNGRGSVRKITDHIQIHHTVGDYGTPKKWKALHENKQAEGNKGVGYSYLVLEDGTAYLGRGHEYGHGGVKDSLTINAQGMGANQRSVAIALNGDMRKDNLPTQAQMAAALRLTKDVMTLYGLTASQVLGHNEVSLYENGKKTGKLYPTLCPCIDMADFRARLEQAGTAAQEQEAKEPKNSFPSLYEYGGSTYVNLRDAPVNGKIIGRVQKGERVIAMGIEGQWASIITHEANPMRFGYCFAHYLKEM